jgi:(E)-4-hydroxy-3-methylbut-2-enyl-diphosphate synthase
LTDGIGDTIRVSLTGDPVQEVPVAKEITTYFSQRQGHHPMPSAFPAEPLKIQYQRRKTIQVGNLGNLMPPVIVSSELPAASISGEDICFSKESENQHFYNKKLTVDATRSINKSNIAEKVLVINSEHIHFAGEIRAMLGDFEKNDITNPVIIHRTYHEPSIEQLQIKAACDFGPMLIDGLADGIWISNTEKTVTPIQVYNLELNLLQASRIRMSKTEYISCPSCGRTLFDLTSTLMKIRDENLTFKTLEDWCDGLYC